MLLAIVSLSFSINSRVVCVFASLVAMETLFLGEPGIERNSHDITRKFHVISQFLTERDLQSDLSVMARDNYRDAWKFLPNFVMLLYWSCCFK